MNFTKLEGLLSERKRHCTVGNYGDEQDEDHSIRHKNISELAFKKGEKKI